MRDKGREKKKLQTHSFKMNRQEHTAFCSCGEWKESSPQEDKKTLNDFAAHTKNSKPQRKVPLL